MSRTPADTIPVHVYGLEQPALLAALDHCASQARAKFRRHPGVANGERHVGPSVPRLLGTVGVASRRAGQLAEGLADLAEQGLPFSCEVAGRLVEPRQRAADLGKALRQAWRRAPAPGESAGGEAMLDAVCRDADDKRRLKGRRPRGPVMFM